jgi:DNA-binding MarR family transcriptional regulator
MKLSEYIRQESFASAAQEALLNVMVTSSWVTGELTAAMAPHGVTPAQYNVLRILRGSHPQRLTCSEVGARLLDRTPDVTRLLNRLQRQDLVERSRAEHDRRVVEVGITDAGLRLLAAMQDDVEAVQQRLTRGLSDDDCARLSRLLERVRIDQTG